ncbi:MAG: M23 family metallopeptidase [Chloroflexota bacterium]|nr:M23 family metallopeptidase [Chloroflexota bacterium]
MRRLRPILAAACAVALLAAPAAPASAYAAAPPARTSGTTAAAFNGRLSVWPVNGTITSPFAPRWGGFHDGIDIAVPLYTPIRAAADGRVVTVGKPYLAYGDTGEVVIVAHSSTFLTLYAHMDDGPYPPTVRPGQTVAAGQVIGYVGVTGWTTGPHVHFMTIQSARPLDPMRFLPPR